MLHYLATSLYLDFLLTVAHKSLKSVLPELRHCLPLKSAVRRLILSASLPDAAKLPWRRSLFCLFKSLLISGVTNLGSLGPIVTTLVGMHVITVDFIYFQKIAYTYRQCWSAPLRSSCCWVSQYYVHDYHEVELFSRSTCLHSQTWHMPGLELPHVWCKSNYGRLEPNNYQAGLWSCPKSSGHELSEGRIGDKEICTESVEICNNNVSRSVLNTMWSIPLSSETIGSAECIGLEG